MRPLSRWRAAARLAARACPRRLSSFLACFPALLALFPAASSAQQSSPGTAVEYTGITGLYMLANISYAGMRAQSNPHRGWRFLAFLFGFPGTLITLLAVPEGGGRAYGIDLPVKHQPAGK